MYVYSELCCRRSIIVTNDVLAEPRCDSGPFVASIEKLGLKEGTVVAKRLTDTFMISSD